MPIVPTTRVAKIEFYESKESPWTSNTVAIGLAAGDPAQLTTLTGAARDAYNAHLAAKAASRAATLNFYAAVTSMADFGSDLLKKIKSKAATVGGDSVYVMAQIPSPAQPSPVPAPGTPTDFKVELRQDGAVILKWKCPNPPGSQGTTYDVRRKVGAGGAWQHIGATGIRTLTDETVPAGSSQVTYEITGFRSTRRGSPANFIVNFGVGGEGEMTASVVATPRMAA